MGNWKINGIDITDTYGVLLRKGANDAFMRMPDVKEYLTETCREENGERTYVADTRMTARDISVGMILTAPDAQTLWRRRDSFFALLKSGMLDFELTLYNRTYGLYYKNCSALSRISALHKGDVFVSFTVTFREPDTANVRESNLLAVEGVGGDKVLTERGDHIEVLTQINQ